jgi:hypothetical protein
VKASFGFGENICWTRIDHALRTRSTSGDPQRLTPPTRWITRSGVKVDRVACSWLIRRFIDPRAEFFFVPEQQLLEAARRVGATAFDANRLSQVKLNHGAERCSFEAILEDYRIADPALHRLALIVRGADVRGQEQIAPESPGLRAIAHGFALTGISDEERLARQFPVYDALHKYIARQH